MSNEIGWDSDIKSGLQELLTRIGLIDSQCGRLIDEIDKSLAWNEEKPEIYSENDRVVFDGPLDEETCLTCLSIMKKGSIPVENLKENEQWDLSPHANCRHSFTYESHIILQKKVHVDNLIQDLIEHHS
jgi:hypothetical protein|tara:strand:+ start:218 stop:604 length:387 start_codon:yes stop_codon:yes gene_type:complete